MKVKKSKQNQSNFNFSTQPQITLKGKVKARLPEQLKTSLERLSGYAMDDVRVHYNSSKPAQIGALAYTKGLNIYISPGQEKYLPHEAWHVVQQKQGRVKATTQFNNFSGNNDFELEQEADLMGHKALQLSIMGINPRQKLNQTIIDSRTAVIQKAGSGGKKIGFEKEESNDPKEIKIIDQGMKLLIKSWKKVKKERIKTKEKIAEDIKKHDAFITKYRKALEKDKERKKEIEKMESETEEVFVYSIYNKYKNKGIAEDIKKGLQGEENNWETQQKKQKEELDAEQHTLTNMYKTISSKKLSVEENELNKLKQKLPPLSGNEKRSTEQEKELLLKLFVADVAQKKEAFSNKKEKYAEQLQDYKKFVEEKKAYSKDNNKNLHKKKTVKKYQGASLINKQENIINEKYKENTKIIKEYGHYKQKNKSITVHYDKFLSDIKEEDELLLTAKAFKENGVLSLKDKGIYYSFDKKKEEIKIATLKIGKDAFKKSTSKETVKRDLFSKKGFEDEKSSGGDLKQYIRDNRGTFTRRYAFVEKNYYQMMEFFITEHMTGRFQQYMMAIGNKKPDIHKITTTMIENVRIKSTTQKLTDEQVAVAHQMYGSLPEQRGVSLTSTPKVGVTYANTGGNFRTDNGFKLKIDLSLVPPEVLLLNHYSHKGISEMENKDYSTKQTHKKSQPVYKYKESALHARELFLEYIKPEWVVEIEYHKNKDENGTKINIEGKEITGNTKKDIDNFKQSNFFNIAKEKFGGTKYEKGFLDGLQDKGNVSSREDHYEKGLATAKQVIEGYEAGQKGKQQKAKVKQNNKQTDSDVEVFNEVTTNKALIDKISQYYIGYFQGYTGKNKSNLQKFKELMTPDVP